MLLPILLLLLAAGPAAAQIRLTTKQALQLAFPGCKVERRSLSISKAQQKQLAKTTGRPFRRSLAFAYVATQKGRAMGTAYFDVHKVRSKKQLLMVAVTPAYTVLRVEVLAFAEPKKYAAPRRWLQRFPGQKRARIGREIPRITGATLTVQATTRCVQRTLAMHALLFPKSQRDAEHEKQSEKQNKERSKKQSEERSRQ